MRLIGITGKAGSGKTTFSELLEQRHKDVGVIHVDDLVNNVKLSYFKYLLKSDQHGERTRMSVGLRTALYKNRFIFDLFMRFRAKMVKKELAQEIEKLKKEGKKNIIIDDWFLKYQFCFKDLSYIVLMERSFIDRRNAVMERDKITKQDMAARDLAHRSLSYREFLKNKNTIKIKNNKGIDALGEKCDEIYNKYLKEKSINTRDSWVITQKTFKDIVIKDNIRSLSKEER